MMLYSLIFSLLLLKSSSGCFTTTTETTYPGTRKTLTSATSSVILATQAHRAALAQSLDNTLSSSAIGVLQPLGPVIAEDDSNGFTVITVPRIVPNRIFDSDIQSLITAAFTPVTDCCDNVSVKTIISNYRVSASHNAAFADPTLMKTQIQAFADSTSQVTIDHLSVYNDYITTNGRLEAYITAPNLIAADLQGIFEQVFQAQNIAGLTPTVTAI